MQFFYEIFPVFLFFITFKFFNIYAATVVGIVTSALQVMITRLWQKKWDRKQLITLIIFTLFGGMTLYFHNPIFVKWKPTVVFWIFSIAIIISQLFTHKPIMQRLMENVVADKGEVPRHIWKRLNLIWAGFFIILGAVNLYVAYHFNSNVWVNFKFYGVTSALLIFSFLQAIYLMHHLDERKNDEPS